MKTVKINKRECLVEKSRYSNGHAALKLTLANSGEDYMLVSAYMPVFDLGQNEVVVKDYSENKGILAVLESAGILRPTGHIIQSGFVDLPICELLPPYRDLTLDERLEAYRGNGRQDAPSQDRDIER
jgi:hypothetical protein